MKRRDKIRCRKCGNLIVLKQSGIVCDKCNTFNSVEYEDDIDIEEVTSGDINKEITEYNYRENYDNEGINGNETTRPKKKKIVCILDFIILIPIVIVFLCIWANLFRGYIKKIDMMNEKYTYDNIQQIKVDGVIKLKDISFEIINYGLEEVYQNKKDVKLFYIQYKTSFNTYPGIQIRPYVKLSSGEYVRAIDKYELENRYLISKQEQFDKNIKSCIDFNTSTGVLIFEVKGENIPLEIVLNASENILGESLDKLLNSYVIEID